MKRFFFFLVSRTSLGVNELQAAWLRIPVSCFIYVFAYYFIRKKEEKENVLYSCCCGFFLKTFLFLFWFSSSQNFTTNPEVQRRMWRILLGSSFLISFLRIDFSISIGLLKYIYTCLLCFFFLLWVERAIFFFLSPPFFFSFNVKSFKLLLLMF